MLHYKIHRKSDKAQWVVFIHGAGGSSSVWFKQLRLFRQKYNILMVDLRGQGRSGSIEETAEDRYDFDAVTNDVIKVMDYEQVSNAHIVALSLGAVISRVLLNKRSDLVKSLILVGAIIRLDFRSKLMFWSGNLLKKVMPDMWLYRLFSNIVMPHKHHAESRNLFIEEAKKAPKGEFQKWYRVMAMDMNHVARENFSVSTAVPIYFIMGSQDYIFLPSVKQLVRSEPHHFLSIIKGAGHVANVDKDEEFNVLALDFIETNK